MESLIKGDSIDFLCKYGKLKGWDICNKLGLKSFQAPYIVNDFLNVEDIELKKKFGEEPLLCRPDFPIGIGYKKIRGRDVKLKDINGYISEVKKESKEGIIILAKHPSTILTGHYIPRYKTDGAIMVLFEKNKKILIDYVGPGFDAGDITKGKAVHTAISISWEEIYENPKNNYKNAKMIGNNIFQIDQEQYMVSRKNRIRELILNLKEEEIEEIEKSIPEEVPKLNLKTFKQVYEQCIDKIIYGNFNIPNKPFGIMLNIYEEKFCVFEIWNIDRLIDRSREIERD